VDSQLQAIWN
jgi:cell division protein ZapE